MRKFKQRDVKELAESPMEKVIDRELKVAIDIGPQLSGTN